jgi:hypothetical protein
MHKNALGITLSLTLGACIFAACGATGSTPSAAIQTSSLQIRGDALLRNLSGQYVGTIEDSLGGKGTVGASLAQYKSAIGGRLKVKLAKDSHTDLLAFALSSPATLTGNLIYAGSAACTLRTTGKYDAATHRLTGSYRAVHGCSGETGTFSMEQQCYYVLSGPATPEAGLKQC